MQTVVDPQNSQTGFFERLRRGLARSHDSIVGRMETLLSGRSTIDAETLEELEELLIAADLGVATSAALIAELSEKARRKQLQEEGGVKGALAEAMVSRLLPLAVPLDMGSHHPFVIMVVGVNGVGKTTTIGKLASQFSAAGKRVLLVAADTFRAAAADQLAIWAERSGSELVRHREGADPAAVLFDGCKAALARDVDVVIVDTAGRLHTKVNLMEELKKLYRILGREIPGAPHETLLVLDAATGQNALSQTRMFREAANVSGLVLTKLDGTAKGGVIFAIADHSPLPIRAIGVGEGVEDLCPLEPHSFVKALFAEGA
jgi:fused signal recognition particle receptor